MLEIAAYDACPLTPAAVDPLRRVACENQGRSQGENTKQKA
jgi:hypothetical protein